MNGYYPDSGLFIESELHNPGKLIYNFVEEYVQRTMQAYQPICKSKNKNV